MLIIRLAKKGNKMKKKLFCLLCSGLMALSALCNPPDNSSYDGLQGKINDVFDDLNNFRNDFNDFVDDFGEED